MSIKIIGVGFPRTGTMTLKKALERLGYNQTYHYKDLLSNPEKLKFWQELDATNTTDWDVLFQEYQATVDFPGYRHYRSMLDKYPNAKVIMTTRPFTDWYSSTYETIWRRKIDAEQSKTKVSSFFQKVDFNKDQVVNYVRQAYLHDEFNGQFDNQYVAEKVFYKHHQEVLDYVPQDKLLVYEVKEGWASLCDFLNKTIPDIEFPHLNKKENFHEMVNGMILNSSTIKKPQTL